MSRSDFLPRNLLFEVGMLRHTVLQIQLSGKSEIAEVLYYFILDIHGYEKTLAMVSLYGPPDPDLLAVSYGTYWSSKYQGNAALHVIDYDKIQSVVAMVPIGESYFLVEKMGMELAQICGHEDGMAGENE